MAAPSQQSLDAAAGAAVAAAPDTSMLLSIPAAELHRATKSGQHELVAQGPMTISALDRPAAAEPAPPAVGDGSATLYPYVYKGEKTTKGESSEDVSGSSIVAAVGSFSWEILPASQTLKVGEMTFVFTTDKEDSYLSVTLAADTSDEAVGMLEAILEGCSVYRESETLLSDPQAQQGEAALATSAYKSSLARGVEGVSKKLATGLLATATFAANGMSKGASKLMPTEGPTTNPIMLSPALKKRFEQTEQVAAFASRAVNGVVSTLASAGAKIAGAALWLVGADKPLKPGEEPSTLREVVRASASGFVESWDSMEEAGKLVLMSARDNSASVIRQRYGEDAAQVSVHSMNAAGKGADAFYSARKIGVKTVAKSAAKKTAKGVLQGYTGVESKAVQPMPAARPITAA